MKFSTEKIRDIEYEIEINNDGQFFCSVDGSNVKAPTLDALKKQLMQASRAKQKDVRVPFAYWEDPGWNEDKGKIVTGVAVGVHSVNDNILVKLDGSARVTQLSSYHSSERCVDPKHADELRRLQEDIVAAKKAREDFIKKNGINLRAVILKAIAEEKS